MLALAGEMVGMGLGLDQPRHPDFGNGAMSLNGTAEGGERTPELKFPFCGFRDPTLKDGNLEAGLEPFGISKRMKGTGFLVGG